MREVETVLRATTVALRQKTRRSVDSRRNLVALIYVPNVPLEIFYSMKNSPTPPRGTTREIVKSNETILKLYSC